MRPVVVGAPPDGVLHNPWDGARRERPVLQGLRCLLCRAPETDAFGAARLGGVTGRQLRVNPEPDREEKPRVDEQAGDFPVYEGRATARLNGTK